MFVHPERNVTAMNWLSQRSRTHTAKDWKEKMKLKNDTETFTFQLVVLFVVVVAAAEEKGRREEEEKKQSTK